MSSRKPTHILGLSAFYHDSAAALIRDGEIVAAAQEERFTRIRHDSQFPAHALEYCLREAGIQRQDLDYVCFYDKPFQKFDRIIETYLAYAPRGLRSFHKALPVWLKEKLFMERALRKGVGAGFTRRFIYTDHHQSHAASAFFPSPFDKAAILTSDGVGEWATTTWGIGEGNRISLKQSISFPHSLGLLYSAFTYFTGFKVNSGEYKLMGLAPFGKPIYAELIKKELIDVRPDGSFAMNMDCFTYPVGLTMTGKRFEELFGGPPRAPESEITQREMDLAASIQAVTEEIVLKMGEHIYRKTGMKHLVMAGGVALNCVANGRLLREGPFDAIWVQPAAGDAGGSLGTALFTWYQLLDNPRDPGGVDSQKGSLLGPAYGTDEARRAAEQLGARFTAYDSEPALLDEVTECLRAGKIVGWFNGRMEFGPRALGARSIIGDARNERMQSTMNLKIKFRESFRPFAPVVLRERAHEIFEMRPQDESPYMLFVAAVREPFRRTLSAEEQAGAMASPDLRKRINLVRSTFPAITHVDYSARVQTVDEQRHGRFYRLMKRFEQKTGSPVLVNTSFNVRGEPIVNRPEEALNCFLHTEMDVLVLNELVLRKEEQPAHLATARSAQQYLSRFGAD
jgi:carbamoyltransferase